MKLFIIAAVLIASVCAEPESDAKPEPWLAYANYGYAGYPYASTYAHAAYPYAGVYGLGYNGYATGYGHYLGKRSADADSEAEAKPWLAYANYGYAGYPYASAYGLANPHLTTYSTAAYAYPYAATYGTYGHLLGKRSADAEAEAKPEAWYGAYGYNGYAGYGRAYGYAGAYAPYSYGYRYASPYAWGYGK